MARPVNLRFSIRVPTSSGQQHPPVMKAYVIYNGKAVIRNCLLKRPEDAPPPVRLETAGVRCYNQDIKIYRAKQHERNNQSHGIRTEDYRRIAKGYFAQRESLKIQQHGHRMGRFVNGLGQAHLTLEDPEVINVPGIREYPLTLECRVLYSQEQELGKIPRDIRDKMYPQDVDGSFCMANRDAHTAYIGEIVAAYIIR